MKRLQQDFKLVFFARLSVKSEGVRDIDGQTDVEQSRVESLDENDNDVFVILRIVITSKQQQ